MMTNSLNKILNWFNRISKNYEIDFYDPASHIEYNVKEVHYDEDRIILFMRDIGMWHDDFYVLNINEIKNLKEERNHLLCSIEKDGEELELVFKKSVVIHHDANRQDKVLKIVHQNQCSNLDDQSLSKVLKEFEKVEAPKIKKIVEYYSLKYPQLSKMSLILTAIEKL